MGKAKKRKHSEEECRPSKKCRQQDGEGEGEEGWCETNRGEVNTSVPQPIEFLYVENRHQHKHKHKHKRKHKHKHKRKHKHKSRYIPERRNEGTEEPCQVSEVERPEAAIESVDGESGERIEQGGNLIHRKHQPKHKKKPCKRIMVSELEEPVADPLWADLCIQRDAAGDTTGGEEDEFSVLHGRWLQTQEEEQRLWEEGEHCVMHIDNHLLYTHSWL